MAEFKKYAPLLSRLEGDYCYHPEDKGGPTMKGVTLRTYRKWFGEDKTIKDLQNISHGAWMEIMKDGYWDVCKGDEIKNQSVAEIIVDWNVNSGIIGIQKVQMVLGVKADGMIGNNTLKAINDADQGELHHRIWMARETFFNNLAETNPSQRKFLNGWKNRLYNFVFNE